jgi:hypothetical protein
MQHFDSDFTKQHRFKVYELIEFIITDAFIPHRDVFWNYANQLYSFIHMTNKDAWER